MKDNLNEYDENGDTPLIKATISGLYEDVKSLLLSGADQNIGDDTWGETPLSLAIKKSHNSEAHRRIAALLKEHSQSKHESYEYNSHTINTRVISCPSCQQKLKFDLPLPGSIIKCSKCQVKLNITLDSSENIYIQNITENNASLNHSNEINNIDDCFNTFSLHKDASSIEIKKAYKLKMKQYHPDKVERLGDKLKALAQEETKQLNIAYSMLKENGYI